ncbi:asparagine synthase (glutamine-hydrolyzing) [Alishewanella sp. d11]|uniref:asparagine synthase (glutamine-hydrolyzing) n=1 Tax=Alishewanella sp. d11 TaxID=3414030 RepID=UPI003BF77DA9
MCGILGGFFQSQLTDQQIHSALSKMNNRGPDDRGYERFGTVQSGELILGHTRLSIIDLSAAGHQPMNSHDGRFSIVFNGEIYNYKELRDELKGLGFAFSTESDTEVLLTAWQCWGQACLTRLIGMFAFVVYDKQLNTITCVRDAFGIKPFFYAQDGGQFLFASDINALLELREQPKQLCLQRAYDYLVHGVYDNNELTFIDGVKHLMPGCLMEFDLSKATISKTIKWWTPSIKESSDLSFDQAAEKVREQFLENVKLHLRSDVPLGAALSGGIDSSAVVCAMRHLEPKADIHTFSYIAKDSPVSEEKWVDFVNEHTHAKSYKVVANGHELLRDLDDLIQAQGEPFGSTSIYAQYRVFQLAKQNGITVTLDGQGADELLAGYSGYPVQRMQSLFEQRDFKTLLSFTHNWKSWPGRGSLKAYKCLGAGMLPNSMRPLFKDLLIKSPKPDWLNIEYLASQGVDLKTDLQSQQTENRGRRVVETLANSLQLEGLPQLLRHGDRNSMCFSVESRVPFLTLPTSDLLLSLPEEYLISNKGETKSVFRAAMRGIVPDQILDRKDKVGFETPEKVWLTAMAPNLRLWLQDANEIKFINTNELLKEFDLIIAGNKPFTWQIWRWVNFVRWHKNIFA